MNNLGLCCRCFQLPYGPEETYKRIKEGTVMDGLVLLEILRYIGYRIWTFGNYSPEAIEQANPTRRAEVIHFYTCSRLDTKTGKCKNYFLRPRMCRVYRNCEHTHRCESTWCPEHISNVDKEEQLVKAATSELEQAVTEIKEKLGADVEGRIPLIGVG